MAVGGARGEGEREMLLDVNMKHIECEVQTNGTEGIAATRAPKLAFPFYTGSGN